MPDPASTKQTTADLVAELRRKSQAYSFLVGGVRTERPTLDCRAADALEALATENARLRGVIAEALAACKKQSAFTTVSREWLERILHGDANAGGGE